MKNELGTAVVASPAIAEPPKKVLSAADHWPVSQFPPPPRSFEGYSNPHRDFDARLFGSNMTEFDHG